MPKEIDFWKLANPDESFDEFTRLPSFEESFKKVVKGESSGYPLRTLGVGQEELNISEEERAVNFHILGQPRQGKSKFLEYQIRKDIDAENGLCFIDPTENGDTARNILRYCAKKGIEKVVYIDPDDCFALDRIPCFNPLKQPPYREESIDAVAESINAMFGVANQTDTNRVRRNLTAVLNLLARNNQTLYETKYFRNYTDSENLPFMNIDEDSIIVKDSFRNVTHFNQYYISTVGRLDLLRSNPIKMMTAAGGIDFRKMVREGWVIICNLSPNRSVSKTQARLLGILIISEVIQAMSYMFKVGQEGRIKKVFYLYLDEAGRFATPQIADILTYYGKIGLRLIIAHHDFNQFDDKKVLTAIKNGCRIKMMFNVSSYKDRLEMCEDLGYGGDLHPMLASYANNNIPKQQVVIKKDKETPVRIRIPNVDSVKVSKEVLEAYKLQVMDKPWYLTKQEIYKQIDARQPNIQPREASSHKSPKTNSQTYNKADNQTAKGKSAFSRTKPSGHKHDLQDAGTDGK